MPGLRTILVPFNNAQPTAPAVKAAKKLAEAEGAYIEGAYCRQVLPIIAGEGITLPGDYLAELTMMILFRDRMKNPSLGFAKTFLRQMEEVLGSCVERGIKVVTNAGGLNPAAMASEVDSLAQRLGFTQPIF